MADKHIGEVGRAPDWRFPLHFTPVDPTSHHFWEAGARMICILHMGKLRQVRPQKEWWSAGAVCTPERLSALPVSGMATVGNADWGPREGARQPAVRGNRPGKCWAARLPRRTCLTQAWGACSPRKKQAAEPRPLQDRIPALEPRTSECLSKALRHYHTQRWSRAPCGGRNRATMRGK